MRSKTKSKLAQETTNIICDMIGSMEVKRKHELLLLLSCHYTHLGVSPQPLAPAILRFLFSVVDSRHLRFSTNSCNGITFQHLNIIEFGSAFNVSSHSVAFNFFTAIVVSLHIFGCTSSYFNTLFNYLLIIPFLLDDFS